MEENPGGYRVYKGQNKLILNPAENSIRGITPPVLASIIRSGKWFVEGTRDRNLIDPVMKETGGIPHLSR
jgi:hypothetical protein